MQHPQDTWYYPGLESQDEQPSFRPQGYPPDSQGLHERQTVQRNSTPSPIGHQSVPPLPDLQPAGPSLYVQPAGPSPYVQSSGLPYQQTGQTHAQMMSTGVQSTAQLAQMQHYYPHHQQPFYPSQKQQQQQYRPSQHPQNQQQQYHSSQQQQPQPQKTQQYQHLSQQKRRKSMTQEQMQQQMLREQELFRQHKQKPSPASQSILTKALLKDYTYQGLGVDQLSVPFPRTDHQKQNDGFQRTPVPSQPQSKQQNYSSNNPPSYQATMRNDAVQSVSYIGPSQQARCPPNVTIGTRHEIPIYRVRSDIPGHAQMFSTPNQQGFHPTKSQTSYTIPHPHMTHQTQPRELPFYQGNQGTGFPYLQQVAAAQPYVEQSQPVNQTVISQQASPETVPIDQPFHTIMERFAPPQIRKRKRSGSGVDSQEDTLKIKSVFTVPPAYPEPDDKLILGKWYAQPTNKDTAISRDQPSYTDTDISNDTFSQPPSSWHAVENPTHLVAGQGQIQHNQSTEVPVDVWSAEGENKTVVPLNLIVRNCDNSEQTLPDIPDIPIVPLDHDRNCGSPVESDIYSKNSNMSWSDDKPDTILSDQVGSESNVASLPPTNDTSPVIDSVGPEQTVESIISDKDNDGNVLVQAQKNDGDELGQGEATSHVEVHGGCTSLRGRGKGTRGKSVEGKGPLKAMKQKPTGSVRGRGRPKLPENSRGRGRPRLDNSKSGNGRAKNVKNATGRGRGRGRGKGRGPNVQRLFDSVESNSDVDSFSQYLNSYSEDSLKKGTISLKSLKSLLDKMKGTKSKPGENSQDTNETEDTDTINDTLKSFRDNNLGIEKVSIGDMNSGNVAHDTENSENISNHGGFIDNLAGYVNTSDVPSGSSGVSIVPVSDTDAFNGAALNNEQNSESEHMEVENDLTLKIASVEGSCVMSDEVDNSSYTFEVVKTRPRGLVVKLAKVSPKSRSGEKKVTLKSPTAIKEQVKSPIAVKEQIKSPTTMKEQVKSPTTMKKQVKSTKVKEQVKSTKVKEQVKSTKVKEQVKSTKVKEQVKLTRVEEQAKSTRVEEQVKLTRVEEQAKSTRVEEQVKSTRVEEQVISTRVEEQVISTRVEEQVKSTKVKEQVKSTKVKEQVKSIKVKEQVKSTRVEEQVKSTRVEEQVISTRVEEQVKSPSKEKEQAPDEDAMNLSKMYRIDQFDATNKITCVKFHDKAVLLLVMEKGKFFLMTELLRRCFSQDVKGKTKEEKIAVRRKTLQIKEKELNIPFIAMDKVFHTFVARYFQERKFCTKLHSEVSVISDKNAKKLFHFIFKGKYCGNGCIVAKPAKGSKKKHKPESKKIDENEETCKARSASIEPAFVKECLKSVTENQEKEIGMKTTEIIEIESAQSMQQSELKIVDMVESDFNRKAKESVRKEDRNIFQWISAETTKDSPLSNHNENNDHEEGYESDETLPYQEEEKEEEEATVDSVTDTQSIAYPIDVSSSMNNSVTLRVGTDESEIIIDSSDNSSSEEDIRMADTAKNNYEINIENDPPVLNMKDSVADIKVSALMYNYIEDDDVIEIELSSDYESDPIVVEETDYEISAMVEKTNEDFANKYNLTTDQYVHHFPIHRSLDERSEPHYVKAVEEVDIPTERLDDTFENKHATAISLKMSCNSLEDTSSEQVVGGKKKAADDINKSLHKYGNTETVGFEFDSLSSTGKCAIEKDVGVVHDKAVENIQVESYVGKDICRTETSVNEIDTLEDRNTHGAVLENSTTINVNTPSKSKLSEARVRLSKLCEKLVNPNIQTQEYKCKSDSQNSFKSEKNDKENISSQNEEGIHGSTSDFGTTLLNLDDTFMTSCDEFVHSAEDKLQDLIDRTNDRCDEKMPEMYRELDRLSKPMYKWSLQLLKTYMTSSDKDHVVSGELEELERAHTQL